MIKFIKRLYAFALSFALNKIKFGIASIVSTLIDYATFNLFFYLVLNPDKIIEIDLFFWQIKLNDSLQANIISYGIGIIVKYIIIKEFVFSLQRSKMAAFWLSILFSLIGLVLRTIALNLLNYIAFLEANQYITMIIAIGLVFFYNYYTKRYAFERKVTDRQILKRKTVHSPTLPIDDQNSESHE